MKKLLVSLAVSAVALAITPAAQADTFNYTFAGSGLDASLSFTALANGDGSFTITNVAGTIVAGTDIPTPTTFSVAPVYNPAGPSGPTDTGSLLPDGVDIQYDNQYFPSSNPLLDFSGVLFEVDGVYINIFSNSGTYQWLDNVSYPNSSNTAEPLLATPEPSSLLLMGTGLLFLAFIVFRMARPKQSGLSWQAQAA